MGLLLLKENCQPGVWESKAIKIEKQETLKLLFLTVLSRNPKKLQTRA